MRNTSSCIECRRRKQKCIPSKDGRGPCQHCLRRYPPVECTGRPDPHDPRKARRAPNMQNMVRTDSETESLTVTAPKEQSPQHLGLTVAIRQGTFGSALSALNASNGFTIEPTGRNAELFHFFRHHVVPGYTSVDGNGIPQLFEAELLPLVYKSPITPKIGLLMASTSQAVEQGKSSRNKETLAIKANVLSLMNTFLKQDFNTIASEALQAVIHLVIMEFFWGDEASMWLHMQGMRKMIKLQGGLPNLEFQVLALILQLTDYELACFYERELLFTYQDFPGEEDFPLPNLTPDHLNCPLLVGLTSFSPPGDLISPSTGYILHDIQKLTSFVNLPSSIKNTTEIQLEASLLYNKIKALPASATPLYTSEQERIFETIRLAALVYTCCISTLTPFSKYQDNLELQELHTHICSVTMSTWKKVPAVLLWILLVACPSTTNDDWGKWLRKEMAVTGFAVGMEDFGVVIQCLKRFWTVQRWIAWCCRGGKGGAEE